MPGSGAISFAPSAPALLTARAPRQPRNQSDGHGLSNGAIVEGVWAGSSQLGQALAAVVARRLGRRAQAQVELADVVGGERWWPDRAATHAR